jgi:MYXO-CTERM domain-containing protein
MRSVTSTNSAELISSPSDVVKDVSGDKSNDSRKSSLGSGTVAGIAIGVILVLLGLLALAFFLTWRRRRQLRTPIQHNAGGAEYEHLEMDAAALPVYRELDSKAPSELDGKGPVEKLAFGQTAQVHELPGDDESRKRI